MGFLDKLLKKTNGQETNFGKLVEKFGGGIKNTAEDLLDDGLGSIKNLVNGVGTSVADLTKSKASRNKTQSANDKSFHQKEVSIANLHGDAILNILNGVTDGNLIDAGLKALQLYNYGTKWTIYTDQYVDKEMYPFRYTYLAEKTSTGASLDESETSIPIEFLEAIEDPTVLGYTVKFDFENSPLFDLTSISGRQTTVLDFIEDYKGEYPEMGECKNFLLDFVHSCQKIFESGESLNGSIMYQGGLKQHYILAIDGIQKLDNMFIDSKEDELKITLNEDVRLFTNKMAFAYRNLVFSKAYGKKLIPENLLRFNMYIKISDQRSFTRNTSDADAGRDAMRNAYSRIIYELKDCEMSFENSLPNEMVMGSINGAVDSAYAKVIMKVKYRKVNRIFYSAMFDENYIDFISTDKFHIHNDQKARDFLAQTRFEDRRISEYGADASKRRSTSNNIDVVPSLSSQYSVLKNRGLFTTDDDDSAVTRFIKTLGNQAVEKGMTYVDEGLDKLEGVINNLGLGVRDKLQSLVKSNTVSLGNVNGGFVSAGVSIPSLSAIDLPANNPKITSPGIDNVNSGTYYNTVGAIGLHNLAINPADVKAISLQSLNSNLYYQVIKPIGLENLATDPATASQIHYMNLSNGNYNNTPAIGLENLANDKANIVPISPKNLATDPAVIGKINYDNVNGAVNTTVSAPKEDLMNGFEPADGLITPVDLMIADNIQSSLTYAEDLMIADNNQLSLNNPVDLMIVDNVQASITHIDDLMVVEVEADGLKTKEDIMVSDKQLINTIKDEQNMMVPVITESSIVKEDLMIAVYDTASIKASNLMQSDVKLAVIKAQDLMESNSGGVTHPEGDLMQLEGGLASIEEVSLMGVDKLTTGMAKESLMVVAPVETNNMIEQDLMKGVESTMNIKLEDLMVADDNTKSMIVEDLMVAIDSNTTIHTDNLMISEDDKSAMPLENLMNVDSKVNNLLDINNINPTTKSDIQAPDSENLMQKDSFKKYLKKK